MSGVTSTIHDSGRVYLFDRNALLKNFIESGMKLSADGLTVSVATGTCDIGGKFHELASPASIVVPQRMACLLYAAKSDLADAPTFGYVQAAFPAADAGTVCRYIINGDATIASTGGTGGGNLTKTGTVTQVDGWIGYAGQGDGSTGYYTSANSTGFPTGAAVREIDIVFTYVSVGSSEQTFCMYGGTADNNSPALVTPNNLNDLCVGAYAGTLNTGYTLEVGKTYFVSLLYTGTAWQVYVNGVLIYTYTTGLNTTAGVMGIARIPLSAICYSPSPIHYVELRNTLRTPAQIAAISNVLLLPCRYYTSETANTYTDVRAVLPADTISLGRVRTGSAAVLENRMDYQDGRREGAVGGNRRAFLGWQYFSGAATLNWPDVFGTRKVRVVYKFAEDAFGRNESDTQPVFYNAGFYGLQYYPTPTSPYRAITPAGGVVSFNGTWRTSGYIGCYAEVIE